MPTPKGNIQIHVEPGDGGAIGTLRVTIPEGVKATVSLRNLKKDQILLDGLRFAVGVSSSKNCSFDLSPGEHRVEQIKK